jgi:urease accessory protein
MTVVGRKVGVSGAGSLNAVARITVQRVDGVDRVVDCWGEPPLLPRMTPNGVDFVSSAAGPLAGDLLTTIVSVGQAATLKVGSVTSSYARPGITRAHSLAVINATVASGGRLCWTPQPLVAVNGCRHRMDTSITLDGESELFWAEVVVLGRHGEGGGDVWTRRSVDLAGRPLNRQELTMTLRDRSRCDPAVLGGARVVASCLAVHPEWSTRASDRLPVVRTENARAGVLHLAGPGVDVIGLGHTVSGVMDALTQLASAMEDAAPITASALTSYAALAR